MMQAAGKYATVIKCDKPACRVMFMTGSYRELARKQAFNEGWSRVPPWALKLEDSHRRRLDACPSHTQEADQAIAERPIVRAQERAAARELRAQQVAARRQVRAKARAEKLAAKEQRKQARLLAREEKARIKQERAARRAAAKESVVVEQPVIVESPVVVVEQPVVVESPVIVESPVVVEQPVVVETSVVTIEAPVVVEQPAPVEIPAEIPIVVEQPAGVETPQPTIDTPLGKVRVIPRPRRAAGTPSNLDVVEQILRARAAPMTVAEIVEAAVGDFALPSKSQTPRTVVARDLAIDVRDRGEESRFVRTAPGTFALRGAT